MGIALVLALESHHSGAFDRDRAITLVSQGTMRGFFPTMAVDEEAGRAAEQEVGG